MSSTDIIYLREFKAEALLGIYPWEQCIKQALLFDIELNLDLSRAAKSELISDTIDYAELVEKIKRLLTNKKFNLLETLVEQVADLLLQEYKVNKVRVKVNKLAAVANVKEIGIIIERTKDN